MSAAEKDSIFDNLSRADGRSLRRQKDVATKGHIILTSNSERLSAFFVPPALERILPKSLEESGVVLPELELEEIETVETAEGTAVERIAYVNTGKAAATLFQEGYNAIAPKIDYKAPISISRDKGDSL